MSAPAAPVTTVAPRPLARLGRAVDDLYLGLHVAAMGFTLALPLLGLASAASAAGSTAIVPLLLVAIAYHLFAYGLNDVVDLPIDRSEPARAHDPLVRGVVSRRAVLGLALLQLPLMAGIVLADAWSLRRVGALGAAVVALAAYDCWGKRCPVPMIMDAAQGIGWAALLLAGVPDGIPWTGRPALVAAMVVVYILQINGIVGPLRDLPNDLARGARTTAITLGARPDGDGLSLGPVAAGYALVLYAALLVLAAFALAGAPATVVIGTAVVATVSIVCATLFPVVSHQRGQRLVAGGGFVVSVLALLLIAGAWSAAPGLRGALALAFGIPVALLVLRNGARAWWPAS